MRLLVITSCTGDKLHKHPRALTLEDFRQGPEHVARREAELSRLLTPAEELYTGQQHERLMRGVCAFRSQPGANGVGPDLELLILSAGYGLVPSDRKLAPYEATFKGMKRLELHAWASQLRVGPDIRRSLAEPRDLILVLLGDEYQAACELDTSVKLGAPTFLFCGSRSADRLPNLLGLRKVIVSNPEASRFSCPLISLKGELAARLLGLAAREPSAIDRLIDPATDLLALLEALPRSEELSGGTGPAPTRSRRTDRSRKAKDPVRPAASETKGCRPNPNVDRVIQIPASWWEKPHREKLQYFIPEWDDLVDPDYDFETDTHSGGTGDWSNEVYAHQLYPEPNYDGILVSKVIAESKRKKKERINTLGVHRFLRVPREFPIMGDCGAFGYIGEEAPPYTTPEILDYYTRLGFDYGVSVDHLIVTATEAQKQFRYDLTIHNAEEFLTEHRKANLPWEPIGAVQGWDPQSYAEAARQCVAMGYRYIALGGLVRTSTPEILRVLEAVHEVVPAQVSIHLFGLARLGALAQFANLGVRSVDTASLLRRAWMGTGRNYLSMDGQFYAAIRIPEADKSFRAKRMVSEGRATAAGVPHLEAACRSALKEYDAGLLSIEKTLDVIEEYDRLITPVRGETRSLLRRTLEAAPWKACPCQICRRDGIQVIIFRGNNRNRRRGFHNTYVFYRLVQQALAGEPVGFGPPAEKAATGQLSLFELAEAPA